MGVPSLSAWGRVNGGVLRHVRSSRPCWPSQAPERMTDLHRRQLVVGFLVTGAGLLGRDAFAQPARLFKIGALTESWGPTPSIVGLRDGLQELGYREDKDFTIGVRFTEGKVAELPAAARDLVRHRVDVIVTTESEPAAKAAQVATNQMPIVVIGSGDPVGLGLV